MDDSENDKWNLGFCHHGFQPRVANSLQEIMYNGMAFIAALTNEKVLSISSRDSRWEKKTTKC